MYNYIRILILLLILDIGVVLAESDTGLASAVMATRGKGVVTAEEFDARIAKIPAKDQAAVLRSADRVRTILSNLLLSSQLAADARQVCGD